MTEKNILVRLVAATAALTATVAVFPQAAQGDDGSSDAAPPSDDATLAKSDWDALAARKGVYLQAFPDQLKHQKDLRGGFGLDSSDRAIAGLVRSQDSLTIAGVLVSIDEAKRLEQQLAVQGELPDAERNLEVSLGDRFGGVTVDHKNGARITVLVVGGSEVPNSASLFPKSRPEIRVVAVTHSLREMFALHDEVDRRLSSVNWMVADTLVHSTNMEPDDQTVYVRFDSESAKDRSGAEAAARQLFGDLPVQYEFTPSSKSGADLTRTSPPPPLWGGYYSGFCTAGFYVQRNGVQGFLSDGHCGPVGTWWTFGGSFVGTTQHRTLCDLCSSDSAFIDAPNAGMQARVYANDVGKRFRDVAGRWNSGAAVGSYIHMSAGNVTGQPDGGVYGNWLNDFDVTTGNSPTRVVHAQNAHLCGEQGNSGGPVYTVGDDDVQQLGAAGQAWAAGLVKFSNDGTTNCPDDELVSWSRIGNAVANEGVTGP